MSVLLDWKSIGCYFYLVAKLVIYMYFGSYDYGIAELDTDTCHIVIPISFTIAINLGL